MVPGLRGIRKFRFGLGGRGKRGGGRGIYLLTLADEVVVMLAVYAKSAKTDVTAADKKVLLQIMEEIENG